MAIAKNPNGNASAVTEQRAAAFISRTAETPVEPSESRNKKPTMIRIPPDMLIRIDRGAKRLGISRSAFIVLSAAEKLERMES